MIECYMDQLEEYEERDLSIAFERAEQECEKMPGIPNLRDDAREVGRQRRNAEAAARPAAIRQVQSNLGRAK